MKELSPGDILLGKYEIKRVLGAGGMGAVYHARQIDLGRDVAIKVPHPEALQVPGFLQRFTREAKTVAKLVHENVVQVYEYHHTDTDLFIVMEFVEGRDLQGFVRNPDPDLKVKDVADILRMACEGLAAAHDLGIVHRDIKPQNIMIGKGNRGRWRVKIMDFGIAHVDENSQMTGVQQLTITGQAIGTPSYMAPEQVRGAHVSHLTDIYSFGCVMFYVFSRRTPFIGTGYTIAAAHLSEMPPSVRSFLSNVPEGYDRLVNNCMAKDPASRPQDAHELGQWIVDALAPIADVPMAEIWSQLGRGASTSDTPSPQPSAVTEVAGGRGRGSAGGTETMPAGRISDDALIPSPRMPANDMTVPVDAAKVIAQSRGGTQDLEKTAMPQVGPAAHAAPAQSSPAAGVAAPAQPREKSSSAGLMVVIAIIAIVGAVGGMAYLGMKDKESDPSGNGTSPTPTPVETAAVVDPTPRETPAETPVAATPKASPSPSPRPTPVPTPTPDPKVGALEDVRRLFSSADTLQKYHVAWQAATDRRFAGDSEFDKLADEIARGLATNPEMASIPQGVFSMGRNNSNPDEAPVGTVNLRTYLIGRYEVTALEFAIFLNEGVQRAEADKLFKPAQGLNVFLDARTNKFAPVSGKEMHPANGVTHDAAVRYAEWLSTVSGSRYRLPTEAEWERAARGRNNRLYPWGDSPPDSQKARYNDSSGTVAVTELTGGKTDAGDIYHMAGNVAEWCSDWYDDKTYTTDPRDNPGGPRSKPSSGIARRVVRGGSFESSKDDEITATRRGREVPEKSRADIGFRLVREN